MAKIAATTAKITASDENGDGFGDWARMPGAANSWPCHGGVLHLHGRQLNLAEETFIRLCQGVTRI
jgi:hypothetical protein